jgi:hypothetical protein
MPYTLFFHPELELELKLIHNQLTQMLRSCRVIYHLLRQRLRSHPLSPHSPFSPACFLPSGYFFIRPCGNQMGTKIWEVVCDEHGIGGSGEYCGGNDAHLDRINVFYHGALGGKYVPRALLFSFEPGVIGAVTIRRRSADSSAQETS